jgi:hypothetical protein
MKEIAKCQIPKERCNARDKNGYCSLGNGQICQPVIDKCEGCERVDNGYCSVYIYPAVKWRANNRCPMATHVELEESNKKSQIKKRAGQQKHG